MPSITISSSYTKHGKSKHPLEVDEQKAAWKWMATVRTESGYNLQALSYMVPNGTQLAGSGKRRAIYMANLKAQGLKPGVSDIVIAYPVGVYHGAYIEMKRVKGAYKGPAAVKAAVRQEQKNWLRLMDSVGYWADVAYGAEEFKRLVASYLRGESPTPLDSKGNLVHDDGAQ